MTGTLPPQNIEAEEATIGALLVSVPALERVIADVKLRADDFYLDRHREIYRAIQQLEMMSQPVDELTVTDALERAGKLEAAGGRNYVSELAAKVPAPGNAHAYGTIVREAAQRRALLNLSYEIQEAVGGGDGSAEELRNRFERSINEISTNSAVKGLEHWSDSLIALAEDVERSHKGDLPAPGIGMGLHEVDEHLGGFDQGDVVVIAARPSMGKSALGAQIGLHVASTLRLPVAVFSVEMSQKKLTRRLLSARSGVPADKWTKSAISEADLEKVVAAARDLHDQPFFIHDLGNINLSTIRSESRRLASTKGLSMIIVDYLQILGTDDLGETRRRDLEVGEITRGLKQLAGELGVPIVLLSQLSRGVESRPDKRPLLSDLRDSGSIEQDADFVFGLYRQGYYEPHCEDPNLTELLVLKARDADTSRTFDLQFQGNLGQFTLRDWRH